MSGKSIILIGMPGAGKSTVGPLLAAGLELKFVDTDAVVREAVGRELKAIVAEDGFQAFLDIQQATLLEYPLENCVVATGGAVVRSDELMRYFKNTGRVIYLKYDFEVLEQRLAPDRRLARANGQTFRQVFEERAPLYEKYADFVIQCTGKTPDRIADTVIETITG